MSKLQLNELKSGVKNGTQVTINLLQIVISDFNDETNFRHKLLLTNTQISKFCKALGNGFTANIKFLKTKLSKMVQ